MKRFISAVVVLIGLAASAWADTKACEDSWERRGYGAASKECRPLAERGDVKAQYDLGNMYYLGMGAPRDDAQAMRWWRKAAGQGHASAQFALTFMYVISRGVPQDEST